MQLKQKLALVFIGIFSIASLSLTAAQPAAANCAGVTTAIINCDDTKGGEGAVMSLLIMTVNILAIGVAIAAVGGVVWAAILYTTAADNPAQVAKSKTVLFNVAIGLAAYGLMFSLVNFLIPGGVFNAAKSSSVPTIQRTVAMSDNSSLEVQA